MELQRQIDRLLAQRASEWHQIMENATDAQRAEFVAWLKQSPLHVQEYLETVYTDRVLGSIDDERLEDVDALIAQIAPSVVPLKERSMTVTSSIFRPRRWAIGAAAVLVMCLAVVVALQHRGARPEYATALGEQRTIELSDSSVVTLNADSRIHLHLDQKRRDIELMKGEALFKVAHDPARPFVVKTRMAMVQAIGTQFNVDERPTGTRVSVLEGAVRVTPLSSSGSAVNLSAGQEAQITPEGAIQHHAKADVAKSVAWRERHLIFDDAPLEDMVYEFNRYSRTTHITLDGVPAGSHHYNGIFDAADPESLAQLLSKEPDLVVERRDGEILIRRR